MTRVTPTGAFGEVRPQPKPRPRLLDKRKAAREKLSAWLEIRRVVLARDKHQCRACQRKATDVHHILYRSRGGKDEAMNLLSLCDSCHQSVHGRVLLIRWTNDRNRAASVKLEWVK